MTSEERRLARYNRRQIKRNHDKVSYVKAFTLNHLIQSAHRCYRGVSWKTSVINYKRREYSNVAHSFFVLLEQKHKPETPHKFEIHNRGKIREVESITIRERVIQKCFCDFGFVDNISNRLIYDNSATLKNKGTWFCLARTKKKYADFMKRYGDTGYVLIIDFHSYFASIDHTILYEKISKHLDADSFQFYKKIVDNMKGLNLGSQLSQISAVYFPHSYDEICQRLAYSYGRYMDDSIMFFRTKEELKSALEEIRRAISKLNLEVNPKKVKIMKASNGFTFLKKKFRYAGDKVIVSPMRKFDRIILSKAKKLSLRVNGYANLIRVSYKPFYAKLNGYKRFKNLERKYLHLNNGMV